MKNRQYYSDIISQSSENLLSIIADIINIATIEAGQNTVNKKEVNLFTVCKQLHEEFDLKARNKNIALNCDIALSDKEALIITDETKLIQILNNLMGNAIKFTAQGRVSFSCTLNGANLEFSVEDTGIGIAPEMHEEVFKRFRQVESAITRKFGVSGLGLAISKANAEILGGKIWLESEIGKGSKFYLTIPYEPAMR